MKISDIKKLYTQYKVPLHIQRHMKQVAKVAKNIAEKIAANGHLVDIEFAQQIALLHDLMKEVSYTPKLQKKYGMKHDAEISSDILKKLGELDLAKSIKTQQFDAVISKSHPLEFLEEKIAYYADKRVAHDKIVTLKFRLEEGYARFNNGKPLKVKSKKLLSIESAIKKLEKELSHIAKSEM